MNSVFVTGSTGFIGRHLVEHLSANSVPLGCLVRRSSNHGFLKELQCELFYGDVTDEASVQNAMQRFRPSHVLHVAGVTKAKHKHELTAVNVTGTEAVLRAAANLQHAPVVVVTSSIAAAGPSEMNRPRTEADQAKPVSNYGMSKRESEHVAIAMSSQLAVSIVRPPVVIGPRDRDALEMFKPVARLGLHLVPSRAPMQMSCIYVQDLVEAMLAVADGGKRLVEPDSDQGIYFTATQEHLEYAEFGKSIAASLGNSGVRIVRNPAAIVWTLAAINEGLTRLRGKPNIFGFDKAREATAGSWACDGSKLTRDTGYEYQFSLDECIALTSQWYQQQGWI